MKQKILLSLIALAATPVMAAEYVSYTDVWNYMEPLDETDPAIGDTDFDSTWYLSSADFAAQYDGPTFGPGGVDPNVASGSGVGPIGYGAIDAFGTIPGAPAAFGTPLPDPGSGLRGAAYFRHDFTLAAGLTEFSIDYVVDDGAFVYLDGVLLDRLFFADTDIDVYGTNTAAAGGEDQLVSRLYSMNLAAGTHTLAISVHQANDTSSDLALAVRLHDDPPPPAPQVGQFVVDGSPTALNASSNNIGNWIDQGGLIFQMDGGDNTIRTETLDVSGLTNVNVAFTFRAFETSTGSGFENTDTFAATLELNGGGTVVNLIEGRAEDTNVDGILQGNDDQTLDEFNLSGLDDAGSIDETFIFSYTVPDGTTDLALVLNGVGAGGSERFELSGITVTGRTIPEPSGVVLALIGLAGFAIRRRR